MCVIIGVNEQLHRRDSIQGIDYIANPFFMNLKVSRTTIKKYKIRVEWKYYSGNLLKISDNIGPKT